MVTTSLSHKFVGSGGDDSSNRAKWNSASADRSQGNSGGRQEGSGDRLLGNRDRPLGNGGKQPGNSDRMPANGDRQPGNGDRHQNTMADRPPNQSDSISGFSGPPQPGRTTQKSAAVAGRVPVASHLSRLQGMVVGSGTRILRRHTTYIKTGPQEEGTGGHPATRHVHSWHKQVM